MAGGRIRWAVEVEGGEIVCFSWSPELGFAPVDESLVMTSKAALETAVAYVAEWRMRHGAEWERIAREARGRRGGT